jgi:quercetin dioxygenase-like cupin family protein
MRRILKGRWLLAGLIAAAAFIGCAAEKSSEGGGERVERVAQATTAVGFHSSSITENPASPNIVPLSQFGEIDTHVHSSLDGGSRVPADWQFMLKTKGTTALHVLSNSWDPGGDTGWHTHPGPSLVSVTQGTLTVYDEACHPHTFSAVAGGESAFVDVGGGDVHLVRNETGTVAKAVVVQFIPVGAARRIDVPVAPCTPPPLPPL